MKKIFVMMFALLTGIGAIHAQEQVTTENGTQQAADNGVRSAETEQEPEKIALQKEVYPQAETDGDLYHGLTKKLTFDRMIPPHGLEITYDRPSMSSFRRRCATSISARRTLLRARPTVRRM